MLLHAFSTSIMTAIDSISPIIETSKTALRPAPTTRIFPDSSFINKCLKFFLYISSTILVERDTNALAKAAILASSEL